MSNPTPRDVIRPWFEALEELDEFIGIRFGHQPPDALKPDWQFISHNEVDGIGGFARILRQRGTTLEQLPTLTHPQAFGPTALLNAIPGVFRSRQPLTWKGGVEGSPSSRTQAPVAVAWYAFSAEETRKIREASRSLSVTVNSLLLRHLDSTIRSGLADSRQSLFWMIPVNLRGAVTRANDEENHSSYITARIEATDDTPRIHREVHRKLAMGQHMLTWKTYSVGRVLSPAFKKKIIRMNRAMAEPCIGAFSNLGQWDGDEKMTGNELAGNWFFSPPVLKFQTVSAGCMTFQNRLTLTLQVHPEISSDPEFTDRRIDQWVSTIKLDFA
ncbi:MAG: hypothetical protein QNL68_16280 [Akkermansiaceae bacterium]